jgi:hypothetical protein
MSDWAGVGRLRFFGQTSAVRNIISAGIDPEKRC